MCIVSIYLSIPFTDGLPVSPDSLLAACGVLHAGADVGHDDLDLLGDALGAHEVGLHVS